MSLDEQNSLQLNIGHLRGEETVKSHKSAKRKAKVPDRRQYC